MFKYVLIISSSSVVYVGSETPDLKTIILNAWVPSQFAQNELSVMDDYLKFTCQRFLCLQQSISEGSYACI